jgi:hypothetical protein
MNKKGSKKLFWALSGILGVCLLLPACGPAEESLSVGTFDSRAIAIAWFNSEMGEKYIKGMFEKHNKAKEEGDEALVKELEEWGPARQKVQHQQAFSIACVKEYLDLVEAELPKVAQEAGVDIIVSKWEVMYKDPRAEAVDVTSHLVKLFNPNERGLKTLEMLKQQDPIPLLELIIAEEHEEFE